MCPRHQNGDHYNIIPECSKAPSCLFSPVKGSPMSVMYKQEFKQHLMASNDQLHFASMVYSAEAYLPQGSEPTKVALETR